MNGCASESTEDAAASAYRVLVLGSQGVGKTTLTEQLMTSEYLANKESFAGTPHYAPGLGGAFWNSVIRPSLSVPWRSCLGYRHAGCLQLSHRRPLEMCGLRTRPRTDVDPPRFLPPSNCRRQGHIVSPPPGRYLANFRRRQKTFCSRLPSRKSPSITRSDFIKEYLEYSKNS